MKEFIENYILIYIGIVSIITFFLYGIDKFKAKKHLWRIPEKTLLGFGIIGGFIGGLLGMQIFRHKTKHWYFYGVNILSALIWIVIMYKLWI